MEVAKSPPGWSLLFWGRPRAPLSPGACFCLLSGLCGSFCRGVFVWGDSETVWRGSCLHLLSPAAPNRVEAPRTAPATAVLSGQATCGRHSFRPELRKFLVTGRAGEQGPGQVIRNPQLGAGLKAKSCRACLGRHRAGLCPSAFRACEGKRWV